MASFRNYHGTCLVCNCALLGVFLLTSLASAQSRVTNLGEGIALSDLGFDPVTNELVFVGSELESGEDVAKVFRLSSDRMTLSAETLVGLGAGTRVRGISSDGSRAAGFSDSPASVDTEGISWSLDAPGDPQTIGFVPGFSANSVGFGAWSGGVVGDHSGIRDAISWTEDTGITILPDAGGLSSASDVGINGDFIVGDSTDFGAVRGATYWDSTGINQLEDPFGLDSTANAVSPNSSSIGGDVVFFDVATFTTGTQAAIWSGDDYALRLLEIEDPSSGTLERLLGRVNDVSLSGYAVGETSDGRGFIWHESFNGLDSDFLGAQIFDDWLLATEGITLGSPSTSLVGIAEDSFGELHFAVNGSAFIVSDVRVNSVPEPSGVAMLLLAHALLLVRRHRN